MENRLTAFDTKISAEDERKLWKEFWLNPDSDEIRIRLVELYLPLIAKTASMMPSHVKQHVAMNELMSAGVVGLHSAISSYTDDAGASFQTYASKRIRGAMLDDLRSQDHLTRTQRGAYKGICAKIAELTNSLGRPPTDAELSEATGYSESEIDRYIGMGSEIVNIHAEVGDGLRYSDIISDQNTPSPSDTAHTSLAIEKLRDSFRYLGDKEQKILFLRHYEDLSVKEIAVAMELSEGRISQIYQKAVLKLKSIMHG